ncbi:MAG TPA: hypothetical protein PKD78_15370, partial [Saprospiraceae bacterium]|nr:hypothetical protein [Saprospiraceae bacterium]
EVSATWCPPCWSYHQSKSLQNCYQIHGPNGDDKLRVLFVEGDPATNINCLYGPANCNHQTEGDWVTGTPFPIFDNAYIADLYQVKYIPTVFAICPNKKAYVIGQLNAAGLWEKARACPVAFGAINAGIFDYNPGSSLREVCDTLPLQPQFQLINLGSSALYSAVVDLRWNNSVVQSQTWTGQLGRYGEATIQFDSMLVSTAGLLTTTVSQVNGSSLDADTSNNVRSDQFRIASHFDDQLLLLRIRTDEFGAETYWELRDDTGKVLESGGNKAVGPQGGGKHPGISGGPGAYGNYALIKDTLVLPGGGCYSIHFVDAYGDGMCCGYGTGYYRLYNLSQPTNIILSGGQFEKYDQHSFGSGSSVSGVDGLDASMGGWQLHLFPNPARQVLYLDFEGQPPAVWQISISNSLGQQVSQQSAPAAMPD